LSHLTDGWKEVALSFHNRWNFPHIIGSIDGKHIAMQKPTNSVVLATTTIKDSFRLFYWLSLMLITSFSTATYGGANGAGSDAAIFNDTELKEYLETNQVGLHPAKPLPDLAAVSALSLPKMLTWLGIQHKINCFTTVGEISIIFDNVLDKMYFKFKTT